MLINSDDIQLMNAFESLTRTHVSDCFTLEETICFIVEKGELGKAIGKGGANISNARKRLGKRIAVFENAETPHEFIEKGLGNARAKSISVSGPKILIEVMRSDRDNLTGRQIRLLKEAVLRHFDTESVELSFS